MDGVFLGGIPRLIQWLNEPGHSHKGSHRRWFIGVPLLLPCLPLAPGAKTEAPGPGFTLQSTPRAEKVVKPAEPGSPGKARCSVLVVFGCLQVWWEKTVAPFFRGSNLKTAHTELPGKQLGQWEGCPYSNKLWRFLAVFWSARSKDWGRCFDFFLLFSTALRVAGCKLELWDNEDLPDRNRLAGSQGMTRMNRPSWFPIRWVCLFGGILLLVFYRETKRETTACFVFCGGGSLKKDTPRSRMNSLC